MLLRHDFYYVFQAYKKLPNYINNIFKIIINQLQIIIFFFSYIFHECKSNSFKFSWLIVFLSQSVWLYIYCFLIYT